MRIKSPKIKSLLRRAFPAYTKMLLLTGKAPPPRQISLEVTWDCNLNCFMCPRLRGEPFKLKNKRLSLTDFKKILKEIPKVKSIDFIGRGEPLVHPDFYEMLKITNSKGIMTSFVTNGTLLDENHIRGLPPNVRMVCVSIDSLDPKLFKDIRTADLSVVLRNLRMLRKLRRDIEIVIQPVIMKKTIGGLTEIIDLAKEVNARVNCANLNAFDEDLHKLHISNIEDYPAHYKKILDKAQKEGVEIRITPQRPQKRLCMEPWTSPQILLTGDIYPCSYRPGSREFLKGTSINLSWDQYIMGNIFQESFMKIWEGENFKQLRKAVIESDSLNFASYDELNNLRKTIDFNEKYAYCKICLWRWGCAC